MKKCLAMILTLALCLSAVSFAWAAEPVKLTLWTFQELHTQFFKEMLAQWNANPDNTPLEIDMQVYPYEDMHNKLTIALENGVGAPDIVDIEINMFANYLKGNIKLADLNDYVVPMADKLVMSRFENYARDGKYYGIDHHIGACVVFYNVELLESAGIDYKAIKTWDDFHAAGKTLLEKTGKPMTTWEVTDCWSIYPLLSQHGGDWLTMNNEVRMDEQVVIDTIAFMQSMLEDGTAVTTPGGMHHMEEYYGWMNAGGCASVVMPFWYSSRFTDYMPDLAGKIKLAPMPLWADGGHKSAQMGGTGTAVVASSENVELAKEWLAFAKLSFEGNIQAWRMLGNDPIMMDVYGSEELAAPNKFFDFFGDDMFDVVSSVLDDIPNTALTDKYPIAIDLVKSTLAYDAFELRLDAADVAQNCADELRVLIMD